VKKLDDSWNQTQSDSQEFALLVRTQHSEAAILGLAPGQHLLNLRRPHGNGVHQFGDCINAGFLIPFLRLDKGELAKEPEPAGL
jgi:hypothetical protein